MTDAVLGLVMGCVVLVAGVVAYLAALDRLRRFERTHPSTWWFGYARDGVNLGAALVLLGANRLAGFGGPIALVLAMAEMLALYLGDWLLRRRLGLGWGAWLLAPLVGGAAIGMVIAQEPIGAWLGGLLAQAAPR